MTTDAERITFTTARSPSQPLKGGNAVILLDGHSIGFLDAAGGGHKWANLSFHGGKFWQLQGSDPATEIAQNARTWGILTDEPFEPLGSLTETISKRKVTG